MLSGADCGGHTNRHLVLLQRWIGKRLRAFHEDYRWRADLQTMETA